MPTLTPPKRRNLREARTPIQKKRCANSAPSTAAAAAPPCATAASTAVTAPMLCNNPVKIFSSPHCTPLMSSPSGCHPSHYAGHKNPLRLPPGPPVAGLAMPLNTELWRLSLGFRPLTRRNRSDRQDCVGICNTSPYNNIRSTSR